MRQVLFHLPFIGWPIFGYGAMLFVAFVVCVFLGSWRARKVGVSPDRVMDMAIWVFVFGILGARITYMIQYHVPVSEFFFIWNGGLVFYGSFIGGVVGYFVAYVLVFKKYNLSNWKMADLVAPCLAVGLCLGRMGCYLNGCCYGNVASPDSLVARLGHFPLSSPARHALVAKGYQTAAGFTTKGDGVPVIVDRVEPGSPAYESGLRDGDLIRDANGHDMSKIRVVVRQDGQLVEHDYDDRLSYQKAIDEFERKHTEIVDQQPRPLAHYLGSDWPLGKTDLQLTVRREVRHRDGKVETVEKSLPAFEPVTIGLHPTQVYESISMLLVFLLLSAFYVFRRHDGEVMVLFMLCYAVHRFLNEILRNDTDPVLLGMTLSQNGSILLFLAALGLGWWLWRKPVQYVAGVPVAPEVKPSPPPPVRKAKAAAGKR
jgi:prolipoprotein diacylglyceryltransferase